MSNSFDKIVEIENRKQLTRRVKWLSKTLYKLEREREVVVKNWLHLTLGDYKPANCNDLYEEIEESEWWFTQLASEFAWNECIDKAGDLYELYNEGLEKFRAQLFIVSQEFRQFGEDLRAKGIKGKEVEHIINIGLDGVGFNREFGDEFILNVNSNELTYSSYNHKDTYLNLTLLDTGSNHQETLKRATEESQRCILALHRAQEAALEFLELLKQQKD